MKKQISPQDDTLKNINDKNQKNIHRSFSFKEEIHSPNKKNLK